MSEFHEECRKWISYIQKCDLDNIIVALKESKKSWHDADNSKNFFKVLLHLAHCADKCYREKLSKQTQVFTIANNICKDLKVLVDKDKFFSAIYYIIFYLLKSHYFKEAKIISNYLFPGIILNSEEKYESSKYHQVATIWQTELLKKFDTSIAIFKKENKIDEELFSYALFHLKILDLYSDNTKFILQLADLYVQKLSSVPLKIVFPFFLQLFRKITDHLKYLKSDSSEEFTSIIHILAVAFFKRNDSINNPNILDYFRQCDNYFLDSMKISNQFYDCYKFFRDYSLNLLETNFMSKEIGERYKRSMEILNILLKKYGNKNSCLNETIAAAATSLDTHFKNFENLVSNHLKSTKVSYDDILNFSDFVKKAFNVMKNRNFPSNYVCKKCSDSAKCLIKTDIYGASWIISNYMRVISKYNNDAVDRKFFSIAKELIEELIAVVNELDESGCKYSSPVWDSCGKTIFNIGLISESKFPKELEKLYEVLCCQIVLRDGLDSKLSSFGLENPVGTSLHRLSNANFNQENYRKALSYTAYNALLSNQENRKKKACDMWANIKSKLIDSEEIQELTLLKCLKTDSEVVKKLGIVIKLEKYDLSDLCLRELSSLSQVKGNMILSMKKILEQLESMKDDLSYARGVLYLCFHALQLSKRKYIAEYITKAIDKLKKISKSFNNQCLLANLNFFNIIEKLYARSCAVSKQSQEANFTVKAFKTLKGKKLYDGTEDENEVVPTYGGISIDEDNKYAKELIIVLEDWENCLEHNTALINSTWEPKYLLESIVICGEYCRLYKFHLIETSCWKLAYKIATEIKDYATCIYVTSRCITLRFINEPWINSCKNYVKNFENSSKINETDTVLLFWLSLADFYLDCKKIADAKILLKKVKAMPNYKILTNTKLYVYCTDIELRNYFQLNTNASQEDYFKLLVDIHYSMINLHDLVSQDTCRYWNMRFQLFACEQMFDIMCNMIVPMNSILSYREVSAHLIHGLKLAQTFGMTLRIAQLLKYLCYIDLLRGKIEDCETKLQDLEHILCLDNFRVVTKTKIKEITEIQTATSHELRDASAIIPISMSKDRASPELKKPFSAPNFMSHSAYCHCCICANITYQYMTFFCSYVRAQLYSLLNYIVEAQGHFKGALKIKSKIEELDSDKIRSCKNYQWKRNYSHTVDGLICLLDYTVFLIDFYPKKQEDALDLIEEIMNIANKNDLSKHWVYIYASELYFQHFIYNVFDEKLSSVAVPDDIPITITNQPVSGCITPKQQIEKTSINLRRKTPTALPIPVITIDTSDVENIPAVANNIFESNEEIENPIKKTKKPRAVRRKILVDECEDNGNFSDKQEYVSIRRSTRTVKKST